MAINIMTNLSWEVVIAILPINISLDVRNKAHIVVEADIKYHYRERERGE